MVISRTKGVRWNNKNSIPETKIINLESGEKLELCRRIFPTFVNYWNESKIMFDIIVR